MKYTLITGASSGMGEEFAKQLARKGNSLILVARSENKLLAFAEELKTRHAIDVQVINQDLAQLDSAEKVFQACQEKGLEVDFLINNAGVGLIESFEKHNLHEIQEMLNLNILTLTKLTYLFIPQLKTNHGTILNVASQAAFQPIPYMSAYSATKAYVLNFTEGLRVELESSGIRVCTLCPGPTYTKFFERAKTTPDTVRFKFHHPDFVYPTR